MKNIFVTITVLVRLALSLRVSMESLMRLVTAESVRADRR
jgi:hypothetical protein